MKRSLLLIVLPLALAAALAACGGGNGNSGSTDGQGSERTPNGVQDTPTAFETERDKLVGRLVAIGASIGDTPDDVREQLLESCLELAEYVEPEQIEPICSDIEDAIDQGDPGKIERVLDNLAALEPE